MKVTVEIPKALLKYIEFIPEEKLPEILLQALEDKIKSNNYNNSDEEQSKFDEILSILSDIRIGAPVIMQEHLSNLGEATRIVQESEPVTTDEQNVVRFEPVTSVNYENDEDDDDDLFDDLMK